MGDKNTPTPQATALAAAVIEKLQRRHAAGANGAWLKTAAHAIDATGLLPRWLSVEDRLPEDDSRVLVNFEKFGHGFSCYYHAHGMWSNNSRVTHWMPLPKPPTDGGDK